MDLFNVMKLKKYDYRVTMRIKGIKSSVGESFVFIGNLFKNSKKAHKYKNFLELNIKE